jgi:hypothetical protein
MASAAFPEPRLASKTAKERFEGAAELGGILSP